MEEFEHDIGELTLVPSSGGVFEVEVNDELIYSKKRTGKHADYHEVLKTIRGMDS